MRYLYIIVVAILVLGGCKAEDEPIKTAEETSDVPIRLLTKENSSLYGAPNDVDEDMPEATAWFSFWRMYGLLRRNDAAYLEHYFDIYMDENHTIDCYQNAAYETGRYYPEGGQFIIGYAFGMLESKHFNWDMEHALDTYLQSHDNAATGEYVTIRREDNSALKNEDWEYIYVAHPNVAGANVPYDDDTRMATYATPSTTLDLFGDGYGNYSGRFVFHHVTTKLHLVMWRSEALVGSADELQVSNVQVYAPMSTVPTRLSWTASDGYFADAFDTDENRKLTDSDTGDYVYNGVNSEAVGRNYKLLATYAGYLGSEGISTVKPNDATDYDSLPYARTMDIYLDLDDRVLSKQAAYLDHERDVLELVVIATYGTNSRKLFYVEVQPTKTLAKTNDVYEQGETYTVILVFDSDMLKMSAELMDWENGGVGVIDVVKPSTSDIIDITQENE